MQGRAKKPIFTDQVLLVWQKMRFTYMASLSLGLITCRFACTLDPSKRSHFHCHSDASPRPEVGREQQVREISDAGQASRHQQAG
jgi:hypothetical protein